MMSRRLRALVGGLAILFVLLETPAIGPAGSSDPALQEQEHFSAPTFGEAPAPFAEMGQWDDVAPSLPAGMEQRKPVRIALDPGHSRWDVGASGAGLAEYKLSLEIAMRARAFLHDWGYEVALTREDTRRLAERVPPDPIAAIRVEQEARHRAAGASCVYVSIHLNGHPNRALRGTETYFNSDNFGEESHRLALSLQGQTVGALRAVGYDANDRGVREDLTAGKPYGHFFSLRGPFPSALVEALFLSNPTEAALLHREEVRAALAEGVARGIDDYLSGSDCAPSD